MNRNILGISAFLIIAVVAGAYLVSANKAPESSTETNQMPVVTSGENPQPGSSVHDLPVEPAAAAARKDLAAKLFVDEKSIVIMQIDERTWSDGCLGLGAGEMCSQALVDGFRVEMLAKGKTYFYRTNTTGTSVRAESM